MSQKLFLNTGRETIKGGALHALKDAGNAGAYDYNTLTLTGVVVDTETFVLGGDGTIPGGDVYEINLVATDSTFEATAEVTLGDTSFVLTGAPAIVPLPGDVVRMETEFMIVVDYNVNGPSMNVIRGAFGSTEATHTAGANTSLFQAAQPVVAGNFALPVTALAAATADGEIVLAVQFWTDGGYSKGLGGGIGVTVQNGLKVTAINSVDDSVVFAYPADGGVAVTSDGLDSVTVNFTDGGAGEDYMEPTDGTDFVELGIRDGDTITIGSAVANDGAYVVTGVDAPTYDAFGVELTASKVSVATASWTDAAQADAITVSQATALTNATLTAFGGGVEPASQVHSKIIHKVTAADVSAGTLVFFAPFVVDEAFAFVADSTGVQLAWDGTVTVAGSRVVTVTNAGAVDWAAGDAVILTMYE